MKPSLKFGCMHLVLLASAFAGSVLAATATIDVQGKRQLVRGFGTCSAWNGTLTNAEGTLLWDTLQGAGLSLHRIMIERTGTPDVNEQRNAKLATSFGTTVWGTPWYSQRATKVSGKDYDTLAEADMQTWANDLVAGLKTMKAQGTPLYAISPQNESDLGWVKYDAKALALWVGKYLGPTVAAQAPETKVMGSEACNWWGFSGYEPVLMADADVKKHAAIISMHLYGGTMKAYPDIQQAGKEFWQTEIYDSKTDAEDTGMVSGLRIATMIHEGMTIANFNAWHFWWIKPCKDCWNGALWAQTTNRPTKRMWVMGNFSRFARPGFVRIDATAKPVDGVQVSAYRDSALTKIVLVAINANTSATTQEFSIPGTTPTRFTPWITDATRNIVAQAPQALSSTVFGYALPPSSVTTLVVENPKPTGIVVDGFRSAAPSIVLRDEALVVSGLPGSAAPLRVDLLDMRGRVRTTFHAQAAPSLSFPLRDLPRGAYVARLSADRETILARSIVKN